MLPQIVPAIADALAKAKLVTISGGGEAGGAAQSAAQNITAVIQTALAAQLVARGGLLGDSGFEVPARDGERSAAPPERSQVVIERPSGTPAKK